MVVSLFFSLSVIRKLTVSGCRPSTMTPARAVRGAAETDLKNTVKYKVQLTSTLENQHNVAEKY